MSEQIHDNDSTGNTNSSGFLEPGVVVDQRYKIEEVLSYGDGRAVYLCHLIANEDKKVAMKVLHKPRPGEDFSTTAKRFRTELVAAYNITHANVVHVFEFIEHPNFLAYTMEYVAGGNLEQLIKANGTFSTEIVRKFLAQISAGLHAIHEAGIIHRELKPRNILITENGNAKITDFGVARVKKHKNLTMHGGIVGTMDYLSPEYITQGTLNKNLDIYSVGVMGYEMLVGEVPFANRDMMKMLTQRIGEDPQHPSELHDSCPRSLGDIIMKALSRDPNDRYQYALEMQLALDSLGTLDVSELLAKPQLNFAAKEELEEDFQLDSDEWAKQPIDPVLEEEGGNGLVETVTQVSGDAGSTLVLDVEPDEVASTLVSEAGFPSFNSSASSNESKTVKAKKESSIKSYFELDAVEELNTSSQVDQPLDELEVLTAIHSDTLVEDEELRDQLLKSFEDEVEEDEKPSNISPSVSDLHRAIEARSSSRVRSPKLLFASAFCVAVGLGSLTYVGPQGQPENAEALPNKNEAPLDKAAMGKKKVTDNKIKPLVDSKISVGNIKNTKTEKKVAVNQLSSEQEEGAIKEYRMLLSLNPEDPKVNYNLGLLYVGRGEYKTAKKYLEQAVRLDGSNATAAYYLKKVNRKLEG